MKGRDMEQRNQTSAMRPVTRHCLKLKEQYVRPVIEGKMRYQVRFDDRGYQAGDEVKFQVVDIVGKRVSSNYLEYCDEEEARLIETRSYQIEYVMAHEGLAPGFVVFSIREK